MDDQKRQDRLAQINERANGQPPTEDELGRMLARYPGDPVRPPA